MAGLLMKYFVLKPAGTDAYAKASRGAMSIYADCIIEDNPELARELVEWVEREWEAAAKAQEATDA